MRLGGFFGAERVADLDPLCEKVDVYGLSAIGAPRRILNMSLDECGEYGSRARELGLVVGEIGMWESLMTPDPERRTERIERVRGMLKRADAMGCRCVVTTTGSSSAVEHQLAMDPYMYTEQARVEFREIVNRILDGLDLETTRYVIEPWHNSFFYQPGDIKEFIDRVAHPSIGLHLDQMNMVSQATYYRTTELIGETFELLADKVACVHLKDIGIDHTHMFLKMDEVNIGDGVMDYDTYLKKLAGLDPDIPCFCEHMPTEQDYALNFARLHRLAEKAGVRFKRRGE